MEKIKKGFLFRLFKDYYILDSLIMLVNAKTRKRTKKIVQFRLPPHKNSRRKTIYIQYRGGTTGTCTLVYSVLVRNLSRTEALSRLFTPWRNIWSGPGG